MLQRSVAMAASVSGSLAEVRTAKALLLLVDDMAFDTIADPLARDADLVAPLPLQVLGPAPPLKLFFTFENGWLRDAGLQETDGVFVDGAYNGSVRMLYDGYLQLVYHHFFSWDRGAVQVSTISQHLLSKALILHSGTRKTNNPLVPPTPPAAAQSGRCRCLRARAGR